MGLSWVIGPGPDDPLPRGVSSLYGLPVNPVTDLATLRRMVARHPGAAWYVENEPNVWTATDQGLAHSVESYVRGLHYYHRALKGTRPDGRDGLDPKATLLGPNVLNWNFSCIQCPGFATGESWTRRMRDRYLALYGTEPPLDVWTVHSYDLDWSRLPQGDAARQIAQIEGMRDWLDSIPALRGRPIWVTEIGYHWGYSGLRRGDDGLIYPTGEFDEEHLERWMREVFGWLNANAQWLNIERWFLTLTYTERLESWMGGTRWPGITLMDGPLRATSLNRFGRLYLELAGANRPEFAPVDQPPPLPCSGALRAC